jgi:hypothetical protein
MSDSDADAVARQHLAVASDIKRYAVTVLKSAALTASTGVTVFVHLHKLLPGASAIAVQTTLDGRPAIRRLAMESVFMSLVADGVPLEGMADFCTAELEAYMAQAAGAT